MSEYVPVTDEILERARFDRGFRHKVLSQHLDLLMMAMSRARNRAQADSVTIRQLQEGARLAVQLTEILSGTSGR
jgi:hypothetical protein